MMAGNGVVCVVVFSLLGVLVLMCNHMRVFKVRLPTIAGALHLLMESLMAF